MNSAHTLQQHRISCPYCGEAIAVLIEALDEVQDYIEDCQVCCRPIVFTIAASEDGTAGVWVRAENETC